MSIRLAYNKYTDTKYAYEVTYEWDEAKQKKVQRQKCIGHLDPETGEIVPNGKRGRPRETSTKPRKPRNVQQGEPVQPQDAASSLAPTSIRYCHDRDLAKLAEHVEHIDNILTQLSKGLQHLQTEMDRIDSGGRRTKHPSGMPQDENRGVPPDSSTPSVETSPES